MITKSPAPAGHPLFQRGISSGNSSNESPFEKGTRNQIGEQSELGAGGGARGFLKLSPAKRLEIVKKLIEDITKEKKTKQDAIDLVSAIQAVIYEEKGAKGGLKQLEVIGVARTYLNDRAPSVKLLLEYVALNL